MSAVREKMGELVVLVRTRALVVSKGLTENPIDSRRAWARVEQLLVELLERIDRADRILTPLEEWETARTKHDEHALDVAARLVRAIEHYGLPEMPAPAPPPAAPQRELELSDARLPAGDRDPGPPP